VRYVRMFDMTNDSDLFWTRERLEKEGAYPTGFGRWRKREQEWLPLMEGKSIEQFNHRFASISFSVRNISGQGLIREASSIDLEDLNFFPTTRYWVEKIKVHFNGPSQWVLGFRDVTNVNNWRTVIAAVLPANALGNTLPYYENENPSDKTVLPLLCANLNCVVLDYIGRLKIQSRHLNAYIAEQLPVIGSNHYARRFGAHTATDIVKDHVLRLTYTAHDMAPFARDMGYVNEDGALKPPIVWNDAERRQLRARLDALYFILYGVTDDDDIRYILSTFPIVERKDRAAHDGVYLTLELILWYKHALEAGDPDAAAPEAEVIRIAKAAGRDGG
jgi:hypothetical protein